MKISKKILLIPLLAIGLSIGCGISQEVHAIDRYVTTYSDGSSIWLSSIKTNSAVNVNIRMYNFDDVQCTVIPSVAYGFVTGMNLQLC